MDLPSLLEPRAAWRRAGAVVVFTNGCFDVLHPRHLQSPRPAKGWGTLARTRPGVRSGPPE